ncbi:MAG: DUF192 domain-containing protein [Azoarcus sp.]|jgi:uncharacterized membrane protein (UPF0127 family)|nr:DUF192 domain-containing protein [Azoarcus sp.]
MPFLAHLPRIELELEGRPLNTEIAVADRFFSRLRGLMFAPPLARGQGLLIAPCNSIHTQCMRGAIEAVFLSKKFQILKISSPLRPWLGLSLCPGAHAVLEWPVGEAKRLGLREGVWLKWAELDGESKLLPGMGGRA